MPLPFSKEHVRRDYFLRNLFEVAVGLASAIAAVTYFIDVGTLTQTAVGDAVPPGWAVFWNLLYILGGLAIVLGVVTLKPTFEVAGLLMLAAALLAYGVAVVAIRGGVGAGTAATSVTLSLACYARAAIVVWFYRSRWWG